MGQGDEKSLRESGIAAQVVLLEVLDDASGKQGKFTVEGVEDVPLGFGTGSGWTDSGEDGASHQVHRELPSIVFAPLTYAPRRRCNAAKQSIDPSARKKAGLRMTTNLRVLCALCGERC
jgi:hypothetical protein